MILDLTNLKKNQQIELDKIFHNCKKKVENLIYKILKKEKKEFIFSNLVSRNPEENNLYYKLSVLKLIDYYKKKGKIHKVILQDFHFKEFLKKKFKNVEFISLERKKNKILRNLVNFFKNFIFLFKLFYFRSNERKNKVLKKKKIILLDIFIIKSMFKGDIYNDRYYGNFLNNHRKEEIFFLPIFFNNSLTKKNLSKLKKKTNFILHSDFLTIRDFFSILVSFFRINFLKEKNILFGKYNIEELVKNELSEKRYSHALLNAIITFHFFKSLKTKKVGLNLTIDWFENQIVDKSFNYCVAKFFPQVKSKGYMGINADLNVNNFLIPSALEKKFKLCPKEIFLINNHNKKFFKKVYNSSNIKIAPAFRNQKIFRYLKLKKKKSNKFKVLVIFTASYLDSVNLINDINNLSENLKRKATFILRFHNYSNTSELLKKIDISVNYKVENFKSIYKLIIDSDCILCRPGTTYYEAKIFQIPLILTRRIYGILPANKKRLVKDGFCFDKSEIEKRLQFLIKKRLHKNVKKKLAGIYFNTVSANKTNNLLK